MLLATPAPMAAPLPAVSPTVCAPRGLATPGFPAGVAAASAAASAVPSDDCYTVTFGAGSIGLTLMQDLAGTRVSIVDAGSQAERCGVMPGSLIVRVGSTSVERQSKEIVLGLLRLSARPVDVTLRPDDSKV